MPDSYALATLAELRRAAHVTLEQMAHDCGLVGRKGRESVSAWERGQSIPHPHKRTRFIDYLGYTLGLRHDPEQFAAVWNILVEQWHWEVVHANEWRQHFEQAAPDRIGPIAPIDRAALADPPIGTPALLPPGSRMPFGRNSTFVGRTAELAALALALKVGQTAASGWAPSVAIAGQSGIGKTELAREFVHRYGAAFSGGVFWLRFADASAVPAEVATCGNADHLALHSDFDRMPLDEQLHLVRSAWNEPIPRLLVFDHCETPSLLNRWRPHGGCRVLITSQRVEWGVGHAVHSLLLGSLDRRESVELLRKHNPDRSVRDADLIAISAELGNLPLALHLAGHYLARYSGSTRPAGYLDQVHELHLLDRTSLHRDAFSPPEYVQHVAQAFALSYKQLNPSAAVDQVAIALLTHAACSAPDVPIPIDSFATMFQPALVDAAIARLSELGLLERLNALPGNVAMVCMHGLVQAFVRQSVTS